MADVPPRPGFRWRRGLVVAVALQPLVLLFATQAARNATFSPPPPAVMSRAILYSGENFGSFLVSFELLAIFAALVAGLWRTRRLSGLATGLYCLLPLLLVTGSCGAYWADFCPSTHFSPHLVRPLPDGTEIVRTSPTGDYGYDVVIAAPEGLPAPSLKAVYEHYRRIGWDGQDLPNSYESLWADLWELSLSNEEANAGHIRLHLSLPNQSGLCGS
jgi:hypothetical protein